MRQGNAAAVAELPILVETALTRRRIAPDGTQVFEFKRDAALTPAEIAFLRSLLADGFLTPFGEFTAWEGGDFRIGIAPLPEKAFIAARNDLSSPRWIRTALTAQDARLYVMDVAFKKNHLVDAGRWDLFLKAARQAWMACQAA